MKSKRRGSGSFRNKDSAAAALLSSFKEIKGLVGMIEAGNDMAFRTLAVVLQRVIDDELAVATDCQPLVIRSYLLPDLSQSDPYPLTILSISEYGGRISPICMSSPNAFMLIDFKKWKNETVFSTVTSQIEWRLRNPPRDIELTRSELLNISRNELGAHYGKEESQALLALNHSFHPLMNLRVTENDGKPLKKRESREPHSWTYLSASIATIAFEILNSITFSRQNETLIAECRYK